jgi:H+-translocating diphosphatase
MSESLTEASNIAGLSPDNYMQTVHTEWVVYSMCALSIGWAAVNTIQINRMNMDPQKVKIQRDSRDWSAGQLDREKMDSQNDEPYVPQTPAECFKMMKDIAALIKSGAITFLKKEYLYLTAFCALFSIIIYFSAEVNAIPYTTCAFLIGASTSMLCGYLGMLIAVHTNWRTTYACNISIDDGFHVAFKGGQVLGFALVGLALLILQVIISIYAKAFLPDSYASEEEVVLSHRQLFECVAGYGLGGSTVALFGRVGGGIYTKAADVGADLAGKVCEGLEEDSPQNPGTIADNVGDNVGDIAGMGADLFGSLAEATCAALVVSAESLDLLETPDAIFFPLIVTAIGILASFFSQFLAKWGNITKDNVETRLKLQLVWSSVIMSVLMVPAVKILPAQAVIPFGG